MRRDFRLLRLLLFVAILITVYTTADGQEGKASRDESATNASVEMILSPDHFTVTSNTDLPIRIRKINHSGRPLPCGGGPVSTGIDEMYQYDIRTSDGRPIPRIPGKEKEKAIFFPISAESWCRFMPGESQDFVMPKLMSVFQMNKPGDYTIQVSLPDGEHPGQMLGQSNVVTVTVKAPQ